MPSKDPVLEFLYDVVTATSWGFLRWEEGGLLPASREAKAHAVETIYQASSVSPKSGCETWVSALARLLERTPLVLVFYSGLEVELLLDGGLLARQRSVYENSPLDPNEAAFLHRQAFRILVSEVQAQVTEGRDGVPFMRVFELMSLISHFAAATGPGAITPQPSEEETS